MRIEHQSRILSLPIFRDDGRARCVTVSERITGSPNSQCKIPMMYGGCRVRQVRSRPSLASMGKVCFVVSRKTCRMLAPNGLVYRWTLVRRETISRLYFTLFRSDSYVHGLHRLRVMATATRTDPAISRNLNPPIQRCRFWWYSECGVRRTPE